jgi:PAS domain S-box-containing protein
MSVIGKQSMRALLLVEDNPGDARLLREMFNERGSNTTALTHVASMSEAEAYLVAGKVDIIVLDLGLPDAQGLGAVRRVRAAAPNVPLVVLTGLDDELLAAQALQEGAQDYLIKGQIETRGLERALRYAIERQTMEQALYAEKERAQVTLNSIGDAVICTDIAGKVTFLNLAAEKMTGWCRQHAVNLPVAEVCQILDVTSRETIPNPMAMAIDRDRTGHLPSNCILIRQDGIEIPIEDSVSSIYDREGKSTGAVIVFRDVSAARTIALQMARSEQSFRYLFDNSPLPKWIYDVTTLRFLAVNETAIATYGYSRAEFLAMRIVDLCPPEDIARLEQTVKETASYQQTRGWRHRLADGRLIDVDIFSHELTFEGRVARTVVALDVTAHRAAEEQLRQAQKMEAVGQLTGGLAHDFNNLLLVIIGNLGLLRELQRDDQEVDELAQEAEDAARRGADLIRSLLAFARRQPLQPKRVDLNALVTKTTGLLSRTLGEQIEISLELSTDAWPVVVDPVQLEVALANLATNARDAMPKGGRLTFATGNRRLDEDYASLHQDVVPGDYAMLEVSDTGSGMASDVLARVFEPFFTTKGLGEGTGLGLSMVFGFVKQSGGHINIYSEIGIGTIFRLYLRRDRNAIDSDVDEGVETIPRGRGERVLVVEDNIALRRLVLRQLDQLGYLVDEAENATTALRLLEQRGNVDLMFADVVMAGKVDGFELARIVVERWPGTKIVMTSGFLGTEANGHGVPVPNVRLLGKPYQKADLARALREVLDGHAGSG